ncbi:MAG TPA: beta-N-acetylhexosaminidase [Devosia sp.]|jgi:hexosaminidase|uniref:beta-N-acetylhexosaminidase n=1 Tax=Devosia sp. TaxID=1871048 RepID=UPI002DDD8F51|nr:beta-N-acetylhexosaminidase [Devosia sp.]HEV2518474.1 beta-N-acetylhexosaminidase [Devosia sp.]
MVADWYDGLTLATEWRPATEGVVARYRLTLTNDTGEALRDFRLGISGPARVSDDAEIVGAKVVTQISNFCELAPERGFVLAPGASWTVDVLKLDYPIRHWTDGATTGFLILGDGTPRSLRTVPTRREGSDTVQKKGTAIYEVPKHPPVPVSIVPWPRQVAVSGRRTAPAGLAPIPSTVGKAAAAAFGKLTDKLFPGEGLLRPAHEGGFPVELAAGAGGKEGYAIEFSADRARVIAETETGLLYGLITLGQILRGARLHLRQLNFPTSGRIEDAPVMAWRGSHLDVARRYYARDEVERFIAILAWNKLNVLHWHLSDDESWRVEIDAYPQLTGKGAWRGYGMPVPPLLGSGPERTGGYYSKADIRAIVGFATGVGVDVVPEIDMPGHCYALLQAIPALRDPGENAPYFSIQSFPNNCLNPGVEATYGVVETILAEMAELFPSRYFHVGADEVPHDAWESSPAARALSAKLGTTGTAPLQAHFLQRLQAFLTSKGKITGAWEEAALGGGIDKASSYLVGWKDTAISQNLAAEGYDVVVAPAQAYYLDMANSEDWHECGAAWAGWSSPEKSYGFEPTAGWTEAERGHLLGIQACIWSEPMTDRAVFDRLVFPRLSAIAETGWSSNRDFNRFKALVGLMPNLYGRYEGF